MFLLFIPWLVSAQTVDHYEENKIRLQPKIEYYANKYHVPVEVMNYIVDHESSYDRSVVGDTYITCNQKYADWKRTIPNPFYRKKIRARGLVQITDCYWPEITNEQAEDEDFALDFLASWLSQGFCRLWSTCPISRTLAVK